MSDATSEPDLSFNIDFARRYIAPSVTPTATRCRRVLIPDAPQFVEAVNEVLSLLTYPDVWQASDGTLTAQECAILMAEMWNQYREDQFCMVGIMVPFAGAAAHIPANTLLCDGTLYATDDYPDLFATVGYTYGGAGTQFAVPDMRGRFPLGENATYVAGATGGTVEETLTVDQMPAHSHTNAPHYHTLVPGYTFNLDLEAPGAPDIFGAGVTLSKDTSAATVAIDNTGGNQAHNNLPPFLALNYIIYCR